MRRPVIDLRQAPQIGLFADDLPAPPEERDPSRQVPRCPVFVERSPADIFIGGRRLDLVLVELGASFAILLRTFLRQLDWSSFTGRYSPKGRAAYSPWDMVGIVLYGILHGETSLRELERLARMDLGCMWAGSAIAPDHSVIGRFLVLHAEDLTEAFFEQLTRAVLQATGGTIDSVAVDGTVLQAACSALRTLKREAAVLAAEQAIAQAEQAGQLDEARALRARLNGDEADQHSSSDDTAAPADTDEADEADEDVAEASSDDTADAAVPEAAGTGGTREASAKPSAEERRAKARRARAVEAGRVANERAAKRTSPDTTRVCPTEPEAVIQPLKNGAMAPSYKPSVSANDQRIVVAKEVHPSNEPVVVPGLLEQTERIGNPVPSTDVAGPEANSEPAQVRRLLADPGYFVTSVLALAVLRDIDFVCPEETGAKGGKGRKDPKFGKRDFCYDEDADCYVCPAGETLTYQDRCKASGATPPYRRYGTDACNSCPLRTQCTSAKAGRRIKRYEGDELKDAQREVMRQPGARQAYGQRISMVEPVFSVMRQVQRAGRFRRRGLAGARMEFSLHVMAYNLRRWRSLTGAAARAAARALELLWRLVRGARATARHCGYQHEPLALS